MFTTYTKLALIFTSYLLWSESLFAKKLEEIFICTNETECNELEKHNLDETSIVTTEDIYDVNNISISSSTRPTRAPKDQVASTTQSPYDKVEYSNKLRHQNIHKMYSDICDCDFTLLSCDINCCCDNDCTDFHLSVFSQCENSQAELFDKRYCYNRNFIKRNNTPFILEKIANNLFCILYDNLPPTYSINSENDIKSEEDLKGAINPNKPTWKLKDQLDIPEYNISSPYHDGSIIWIIYNNYIQPFEILQSGFNELCVFKKTLNYLREWKHQCLQTNLINTNEFLFPRTFNNFKIVVSHLLNETYIQGLEQVCPRNVCLTITNHYCQNSWKMCSNNSTLGSCMNGTCYNIVTGIKYLIVHNGSMGIKSIDIYFSINNASQSFYQQFEVTYEWAGSDVEKSFSLSGNPGYIIGKPLIIGTMKLNQTNTIKTRYITFDKKNSYLTLPVATRFGECNNIDRYTLAFGENIKLKCSISVHTTNFNSSSCIKLQNLIMHTLMKDSLFNITQTEQYNIYIAKSGNFSSTNIADWKQILLNRIPKNSTTGHFISDRLYCSNLTTSMHLNILYSALKKPDTLSNYNVRGVSITFSEKSNVSWPKCLSENCTDILKIDVASYVTFYDVSQPSKYYFAGGPNLDLTLPYDFLNPFFSNSMCIKSNVVLISVALSVILHDMFY